MICPYCGVDRDRVIDSRSSENGAVVRRRRQCLGCNKRFTTYERVEKSRRLMVVKKDGTRQPFDPERIMKGLQAACGKRPIAEHVKSDLVQSVEDDLHREFDREVDSAEVGRRVARLLREVDDIAYIRYASEYYQFRSLDDLAEELTDLRSRVPDSPDQGDLFSG